MTTQKEMAIMKAAWIGIGFAAAGLSFNACADLPQADNPSTPRVTERIEVGTVETIDLYRGDNSPPGLGAVLGGIAGGVVGHQVGHGRGKDVATVAGALGGAYIGNNVQKSNERDRYRITVRLENGAKLVVEQAGESELRVGDRVRVVNDRVFRQ
jgi:outer membrane lipoprotein SlyB